MDFVVNYHGQHFDLTQDEATQLVNAAEKGAKYVRFSNPPRFLGTGFDWIVPAEEIETTELDGRSLCLAEEIADWLTYPAHNLDFTPASAFKYAKKIVSRIGRSVASDLFDKWARGSYPSAKKFLAEAGAVESGEQFIDYDERRLLE